MFAKCVLGLLLAASAHWPMAANAQSAPSNGIADKGLIIRVMDRLLFIDMGRQEGVQAGDDAKAIMATKPNLRLLITGDMPNQSASNIKIKVQRFDVLWCRYPLALYC